MPTMLDIAYRLLKKYYNDFQGICCGVRVKTTQEGENRKEKWEWKANALENKTKDVEEKRLKLRQREHGKSIECRKGAMCHVVGEKMH